MTAMHSKYILYSERMRISREIEKRLCRAAFQEYLDQTANNPLDEPGWHVSAPPDERKG